MAKRPLLRGNWVSPAAAIFLSLALPGGPLETRAFAEGEGVEQNKPSTPTPASALEKKPEEASKTPPEEKAKEAPIEIKGAETKPAAPTEAKAEPKPAEPKSADVKPSEAKPAEVKQAEPKEKPAEPREVKTEAKPKDLAPKVENAEDFAVRASNVNAVYNISWLGANIGSFRIRSSITNRQYTISANADVSVFFGTVTWQGVTNSRGLMTANGPVPQNYTFRYSTNDKREAIELRFQQRMVQDIIINPPQHPGARNVPITAAHLQNVLDPLSALVLLSQARQSRHSGDACNKRLPIFDGKTRYDLVLSPKGTRTIGTTGKLRGTAYVCSVRYVPLGGHRLGKHGENDYATGNTGIEVWLVPVPEAGLLVPYYVHVPTPAGTASMVTSKFDVDTPSGRHALAE
jgi:hypothetical protein